MEERISKHKTLVQSSNSDRASTRAVVRGRRQMSTRRTKRNWLRDDNLHPPQHPRYSPTLIQSLLTPTLKSFAHSQHHHPAPSPTYPSTHAHNLPPTTPTATSAEGLNIPQWLGLAQPQHRLRRPASHPRKEREKIQKEYLKQESVSVLFFVRF